MDPLFDLVRDRTQDLRRTADAARRERELRGSTPYPSDHRASEIVQSTASPVSARVGLEVPCGDPRGSAASRAA